MREYDGVWGCGFNGARGLVLGLPKSGLIRHRGLVGLLGRGRRPEPVNGRWLG
jgi:hypothetical protein